MSAGNCSLPCSQGWTESPSFRGSLDIIWSSLTIILLCSWSNVCCNIPAPGERYVQHFRRKAWLTIISIIGPEFLLYIAMCQWLSARRSVADFHKARYYHWTMKHAFLADMGGFRLRTPGAESFPLNAKSLLYLIEEGHINQQQTKAIVELDPETIEDRNKADSTARLVALLQSLWFGCNMAARWSQGLAITTLELTVIGFLAPTIATYLCWWHKPRDVMTAHTITIDTTLSSILSHAGLPVSTEWHRSPLDFIERTEGHGSLCYRYWINILKYLTQVSPIPITSNIKSSTKYIQHRQRRSDNDIVPFDAHWKRGWIEIIPTMPYLAINFAAWNFHFPTKAELWMWRGSSIAMAVTFLVGAVIETGFLTFRTVEAEKQGLERHRDEIEALQHDRHKYGFDACQRLRYWRKVLGQKLRNNSADDDPNLDVPLRMLLPATIFATLYLLARTFILVEDIIAFRSMPSSTFQTVSWTMSVPHVN